MRLAHIGAFTLCLALASSAESASDDPLTGAWKLDPGRTHYGVGADPRRRETFVCAPTGRRLTCTIRSVRSDGRSLMGTFEAAYDGVARPVAGIPDVDQVILRLVSASIADATFSYKGKPVFGYRAFRSGGGRSLLMVAVDPTTRATLTSVVAYERQ